MTAEGFGSGKGIGSVLVALQEAGGLLHTEWKGQSPRIDLPLKKLVRTVPWCFLPVFIKVKKKIEKDSLY